MQPQLVAELAIYMSRGSVVFLQSDIDAVAVEMCDRFVEHPAYQRQSEWLTENTLPSTEREQYVSGRGELVYRALFMRF